MANLYFVPGLFLSTEAGVAGQQVFIPFGLSIAARRQPRIVYGGSANNLPSDRSNLLRTYYFLIRPSSLLAVRFRIVEQLQKASLRE